jgi:hypothetical protein
VIRRRTAQMRALVAGLAVVALTAGGAAAATPAFSLRLHARLAPVAGTTAAGRFDGGLVMTGGALPYAKAVVPRVGNHWRLTWRLNLPALNGPISASLQLRTANGAASSARMLCTQCTRSANGTLTLTGSQALRILRADAVVVVRTQSSTLRGTVKVVHVPVALKG